MTWQSDTEIAERELLAWLEERLPKWPDDAAEWRELWGLIQDLTDAAISAGAGAARF